jgi:type IV pilus assembly protein PilQ
MQFDVDGQLISLSVRDAPLNAVLSLIAEQQGLNIVTGSDLNSPITVTLHDVTVEQALNSILKIAGCAWHRESDIIYVSSIRSESHIDPNVQGREVRVFSLDYVSATDVEKVVQGLLSPVGNIFSAEADSKNKRKTGETIVVEDLPAYVRRVEQYIAQIDQPPRQVLIEAHILEVKLSDNMTHGVNFDYLAEIANTKLQLETTGFANPMASTGMLFSVEGSDLSSLVEALQTTNDAKTLASPKVLVLNGQEARIQIGERLGYFVTTTTQTSTLQQVQFLDVGIVLRVTPQITASGQVIMTVSPEISSGEINDATGLPDKATTEVETAVILNDGRGIIIGGLIQEADTDKQSKVPFIGDLWGVGRAFQRRVGVRDRSEIIVALVPRVVPYTGNQAAREESEVYRATTPLLDENLKRYPRSGEGSLPDAMRDPRRISVKRLPDAIRNLKDDYPLPPEYYLPANSEHGEYIPDVRYDAQQVPVYSETYSEPVVAPYEE